MANRQMEQIKMRKAEIHRQLGELHYDKLIIF